MSDLGNVGKAFQTNFPYYAYKWYTLGKQPISVNMTGVSSVPYAFVSLFRNSVLQDRSGADSSGEWHFYDMDDSGTQDYTIVAFTQEGATGESWTATVVGSTVVISQSFTSNRTRSFSYG